MTTLDKLRKALADAENDLALCDLQDDEGPEPCPADARKRAVVAVKIAESRLAAAEQSALDAMKGMNAKT